jgi:nucleotide-binding universal stress UspA family protein
MNKPLEHILVPTDFSPQADHALLYAASLAERFGASLHLLHVVTLGAVDHDGEHGVFPDLQPILDRADGAAREQLDRGAEHGGAANVTVVQATERAVNAYEGIIQYAGEQPIDLLVIAMRSDSGVKRALMGSVTERVIRYAPCPVLIVEQGDRDFIDPETGAVNPTKVVVAHDFRDNAQLALAYAVDKLGPYQPEIHLVHAKTDLAAEKRDELTAALEAEGRKVVPEDWTLVCHVAEGKANQVINEYAAAQQADLLVVGSETKRTLGERIKGGMSERFVRAAPCPTLIV